MGAKIKSVAFIILFSVEYISQYYFSPGSKTSTPAPVKTEAAKPSVVQTDTLSDDEDGDGTGAQGDIQPVGHDYVEEVRPFSQNIEFFAYCVE